MEEGEPKAKTLVYCWGKNDYGQLGTGKGYERTAVPIQALRSLQIKSVAAGPDFSAAITEDGRVYMFGKCGRLIAGQHSAEVLQPLVLEKLKDEVVTSLSCGGNFVMAITELGHIYGLGTGKNAQLGVIGIDSTETPTFPKDVPEAKQVACGFMHTLALTTQGEVWVWGSAGARLGMGEEVPQTLPKPLPTLKNVVKVACGKVFSAALTGEGEVYTWGEHGQFGQLGLGVHKDQRATNGPTKVSTLDGKNVVDIACGDHHCLCIVKEGSNKRQLWAWGRNGEGQLGCGNNQHKWVPEIVPFFSDKSVLKVACGAKFSLVLTDDYSLYAFGQGGDMQLGQKKLADEWTPRKVVDFDEDRQVLDFAAGQTHVLVLSKVIGEKSETLTTAEVEDMEDNEWEVEEVLDQRKHNGVIQYLIKWKGYGPERNSWEPAGSVDCPQLIEAFLEKRRAERDAEKEKQEEELEQKRKRKSKGEIKEAENEDDEKEEEIKPVDAKKKGREKALIEVSKGRKVPVWVGDPIKEDRSKKFYKALRVGPNKYNIGDTVAVANGDLPDMFAEIESFYELRGGKKHVNFKWLYKPTDTVKGRRPEFDENELFASKHTDDNPVGMIVGPAKVLSYADYQSYLKRKKEREENREKEKEKEKVSDEDDNSAEQDVYFVRQFYDHLLGKFTECGFPTLDSEGNLLHGAAPMNLDDQANGEDNGYQSDDEDEEEEAQPTRRNKRKRETPAKEKKPKAPPKKQKQKKKDSPTDSEPKKRPGRLRKSDTQTAEKTTPAPKKTQEKEAGKQPAVKANKAAKPTTTTTPPSTKSGKSPVKRDDKDKAVKKENEDIPDISAQLQKAVGSAESSERVKEMLAAGADPFHQQGTLGQCSIHYAAAFGRDDNIRILLEHNRTLLDFPTKKLWTPLHYATYNKHLNAVKMLLNYGANTRFKNGDGKTPLDIARERNLTEVEAALRSAMELDESVVNL